MSYLPECDRRCQSFRNSRVKSEARGRFARLLEAGFFEAIQ